MIEPMTIYDAIVRAFPYAAYQFTSAATSYANIMGNTNTATLTSATQAGFSLTGGGSKAIIAGAGNTFTIPFPGRFSKEFDGLSFTLEGWFCPETTGPMQFMGHTGATDGLYFDGENIEFGVDLDAGGSATASWPIPDFTKAYYLVGVYDGQKVSLLVDGDLAAETTLPDGAVLASKANKNLLSSSAAGKPFTMEAPAVYYRALGTDEVARNYAAGKSNVPALGVVSAFGGAFYKFSDAEREILTRMEIDFRTDGIPYNVAAASTLTPVYTAGTGLSEAGTYTIIVPVSELVLTTPVPTQGMKLEWNGDGNYTVQFSLNDGSTWTTAVNGAVQAGTVGMARTITPQVKVTFASGRAAGLDIMRDLTITVYSTNVLRGVNSNERKVTATGGPSTSTHWYEPIEQDTLSGTIIRSTQNWIVSESTEVDRTNVGAIELLVEFQGSPLTSIYLFDSRSVTPSNASYMWLDSTGKLAWSGFSAVYVNGVATTTGTLTPVAGRQYDIIGVYSAVHNAKILVGTVNATTSLYITFMALYDSLLTAAQVASLYSLYQTRPVLSVVDTNAIVVSETDPAAKAYVKDWASQGGG